MNLNQYDREAFVKAVMNDVPQTDYSEIAIKKVTEWEQSRLPDIIKKAIKAHPGFFERKYTCTPGGINNAAIYCDGSAHYVIRDNAPELWAELKELGEKASEQARERSVLESKLDSAIRSCRTLKQAKELLPEFEKYLPQERDGTVNRSVPVVANLVADLSKAGWPKDQKKPSRTKKASA